MILCWKNLNRSPVGRTGSGAVKKDQKFESDLENKGVSKFDPENKGVSGLILKTKGFYKVRAPLGSFSHEKGRPDWAPLFLLCFYYSGFGVNQMPS